ncbi:Ger(x)C family spore germination protein [Bacillus sp. WLY-B-L8]|uniref:Ger(x)C family spore germination protein n=1 Tax=Bacillus multifaciens TaxID=3068506 RepID=UPI0027427E23|nr:Ger(x)C family spore germination protein [Bacillus sp. WLY-B-L8]MDP7978034.1 Ger(x)C family spore germination protein [Bacillus sp. WLY-B-L8]
MKRKLVVALLCTFMLTGCWDRLELNEMGIVVAVGIDKNPENNQYIFTSQVLRPGALAKDGSSKYSPVNIITTKGDTIFEAIGNVTQELDRKEFYPHNKVIVIDEQLAKKGMIPILDASSRGKGGRGSVWLCIARNTSARKTIGVKDGIGNIQGNYLNELIKDAKYNPNTSVIQLVNFYKKILESGIAPVTGVLTVQEKMNLPVEEKGKASERIKMSGAAVFRKDKLVGYLNEKETRGYNWLSKEKEDIRITLPSLLEKGKLISINVLDTNPHIKPVLKDGKISFTIKVKQTGVLVEQQSTKKLDSPKEILDYTNRIEEKNKQLIEKDIERTIRKAQALKSDIFGFGRILSKEYPNYWKKVEKDWDNRFPEVEYSVKADVIIKRVGFSQGPYHSKF